MPIRINFLAEELAAEQMRRQDPVKRNVVGAAAVVGLMVVWVVAIILLGLKDKSALSEKNAEWEAMKSVVEEVEADEKLIKATEGQLMLLSQIATNRFNWAPVLNALQQTLPEHVAFTRFSADQNYIVVIPPPPPRGSQEKPKPPTATQRISFRVRAVDTGDRADRHYATFMKNLSTFPYFAENLVKPNGVRFAQPPTVGPDPNDQSKMIVSFELECVYPEVVR